MFTFISKRKSIANAFTLFRCISWNVSNVCLEQINRSVQFSISFYYIFSFSVKRVRLVLIGCDIDRPCNRNIHKPASNASVKCVRTKHLIFSKKKRKNTHTFTFVKRRTLSASVSWGIAATTIFLFSPFLWAN